MKTYVCCQSVDSYQNAELFRPSVQYVLPSLFSAIVHKGKYLVIQITLIIIILADMKIIKEFLMNKFHSTVKREVPSDCVLQSK